MKRFYQMGLIVTVISVLSLVSCGVHSKNSYLKEFESFVDKVENTDFDTEAEWNEALKEYERFTTTYYEEYKDKLTEEDLVEIGRLQGRFMKASMTRGAKFIEKISMMPCNRHPDYSMVYSKRMKTKNKF